MHTIRGQKTIEVSQAGFRSSFARPDSTNQSNRLKIREFISWSLCFAVITVITGLLKVLKIGITMDTVTSVLFYFSIAGLGWFIYKIFSLPKYPVQGNNNHDLGNTKVLHELN
ncbi:MAG TPA: hypothetical protein VK711_04095 [Puia sp.]|jgi:hypothetical protein|nr:hypothetical protein [Puia sp.]